MLMKATLVPELLAVIDGLLNATRPAGFLGMLRKDYAELLAEWVVPQEPYLVMRRLSLGHTYWAALTRLFKLSGQNGDFSRQPHDGFQCKL